MTRLRPALALLVSLLYATTGVLLEVAHHDELGAPPGAVPSLAAHTCSGYEHHIPIDQWSSCPACVQAAQRVSIPAAASWTSPHTAPVAVAVSFVRPPAVSHPCRLLPSKRGPPAA
ncbi:MAG TPA: hypothetical protein VF889_08185 [Bacteroidota bacterium]